MKKQFENPEVEVDRFELEDLITTSGGGCDIDCGGDWCPEK